MKCLGLLFMIVLFLLKEGNAQLNLVPNPSFENHDTCPYNYNQIYFASPWFQPWIYLGNTTVSSSSDYYNSCSGFMNVPNNPAGFQYARTGNSYAGIFFYATNETREYIEVRLLDSLIAGKKYCIEFYVSPGYPYTLATDDLHAYFSIDSLLDNTPGLDAIPLSPSLSNLNGNYPIDTLNWTLISGEYIALGSEKFMTIGNFFDNANTDTIGNGGSVYYFIDDVSVIDCGWSAISESSFDYSVNIFPNPSNGSFEIRTPTSNKYDIFIYNLVGERLDLLITRTNNDYGFNLSDESAGIYLVVIRSNTTTWHKKILLTK